MFISYYLVVNPKFLLLKSPCWLVKQSQFFCGFFIPGMCRSSASTWASTWLRNPISSQRWTTTWSARCPRGPGTQRFMDLALSMLLPNWDLQGNLISWNMRICMYYSNIGVGWSGRVCMWWMAGWLGANFGSSQPADLIPLLLSLPPLPDALCGVMGGRAVLGFQPSLHILSLLVWFGLCLSLYFDT